jgi:homoserine kinase type II
VPRTIHDRDGRAFLIGDKALALIEFLPGVSVSHPTPAQARAVGARWRRCTGRADFPGAAPTAWAWPNRAGWPRPAGRRPGRSTPPCPRWSRANWPRSKRLAAGPAALGDPRRPVPDNVLMLGDTVTGLIDFYFACTDITAYDIAVTHAAWCFDGDGTGFDRRCRTRLLAGYESVAPAVRRGARRALPVLAQGAALRFLMTRAYDWLNTPGRRPGDRKDPDGLRPAAGILCRSRQPRVFAAS